MKLPSFQFYPGDWMKDANLRRCSHASRGVWIDMLCLMFECEDRGVLQTAGTAWSDDEIAQAVGGRPDVAVACVIELIAKGVAHRNASGAVYSKRLVRDQEARAKKANNGRTGGEANRKQTGSTLLEDEDAVDNLSPVLTAPAFLKAWSEWLEYRRIKKPVSGAAAAKQRRKCHEMGLERSLAAIKHSIANDYQGLFEPNNVSFGTKKAPSRSTYENFQDGERKR